MSVVPNIAFVFPDSLPQMHTCIQTHTSYHTQRDVSIKLFQEATEQRGDRQSCSQIQVCQRKAVGCCQGWMSILPRNGKRMKKQTLHIVWNSIAWFLCLPLHNNHVRVPDSDGLCAPICAPVCYIDSCVCICHYSYTVSICTHHFLDTKPNIPPSEREKWTMHCNISHKITLSSQQIICLNGFMPKYLFE